MQTDCQIIHQCWEWGNSCLSQNIHQCTMSTEHARVKQVILTSDWFIHWILDSDWFVRWILFFDWLTLYMLNSRLRLELLLDLEVWCLNNSNSSHADLSNSNSQYQVIINIWLVDTSHGVIVLTSDWLTSRISDQPQEFDSWRHHQGYNPLSSMASDPYLSSFYAGKCSLLIDEHI